MFENRYVLCADKNKAVYSKQLAALIDAELVVAGTFPKKAIKETPVIINYGRSAMPVWYDQVFQKKGIVFNKPDSVGSCVNKYETGVKLTASGIKCVEYMKISSSFLTHAIDQGDIIVIRDTLVGSQGKGISFAKTHEELADAMKENPLAHAALYWFKTHEFRAHVAFGEVVSFTQKKRMGKAKLAAKGLTKADPYVRNHKNGWVFAHNNLAFPEYHDMMSNTAIEALKALDLDFGAVDILFKEPGLIGAQHCICEVNSAPGLGATKTKEAYSQAILDQINKLATALTEESLAVPGSELIV